LKIKAEIIADSISVDGNRLTTMECTFHRFILPEFNTYRKWSRNAQSSRAVPISKRIKEVQENTAFPVYWGKNQKGMVAEEELDQQKVSESKLTWLEAALAAADYATILAEIGLHKQTASRILEPYLWHTSVVSSTEWDNMFNQRIHPDAQPEFKMLAEHMFEALSNSKPELVNNAQWHLPYVSVNEKQLYEPSVLRQVSVARVARTSYGKKDEWNLKEDIALFERLALSEPIHYSPLEHVARPSSNNNFGNFDGWQQLRHMKDYWSIS
jgi:thymidylate synthase ThyX